MKFWKENLFIKMMNKSLFCDWFQLYSLHSDPYVVQAIIQQQFWIVGCRSLLRSCIHKCLMYKFLRIEVTITNR